MGTEDKTEDHSLRNDLIQLIIGDGVLAAVIYLLIDQISTKLDFIISLLQAS